MDGGPADLPPKWRRLAADLLRKAAEHYSCHGCNDYRLPADWTDAERRELVAAMGDDPGSVGVYLMDWMVMDFLADRLSPEAKPDA
jgi:hypothetical protein